MPFPFSQLSSYQIAEVLASCHQGVTPLQIVEFTRGQVDRLVYNPLGISDQVDWTDFFEKFKLPDNLYQRISSNLVYYARAYLRLAFFATLLISASQGDWLIRATIGQYIVALLPRLDTLPVADVEYFRLIGLSFTQLLIWTSFARELVIPPTALFASALVVGHATFRTKTWTRAVSDFFRKKQS